MAGYVLEIKPSARRRNVVAAEWVQAQGTRRVFHSRAAASRWAARVSTQDSLVWVQDAPPNDPDPVDGYLVSGRRVTSTEHADSGEQATLTGEPVPSSSAMSTREEGAEEEI